jgi:TonB family protein
MKQFNYFILCCTLFMPMCVWAQQTDAVPLTLVDQMPVFPGGEAEMFKYLSKNIKYPVIAQENEIEGTVYISFVVNEDGQLSNFIVKRGVAGGCTEESLRVLQSMPKWTPGKHKGQTVKVNFTLPVKFKLDDPEPIYTEVDTMPHYPEGEKAMFQFLAKNIKYSKRARENRFQGTVKVVFVVNADGTISNPMIKQSVGGGCDEEAVRVIKLMPKWIPGIKNGKNVAVYYTIPIKFVLD